VLGNRISRKRREKIDTLIPYAVTSVSLQEGKLEINVFSDTLMQRRMQ
jgi:hypothetical protein